MNYSRGTGGRRRPDFDVGVAFIIAVLVTLVAIMFWFFNQPVH